MINADVTLRRLIWELNLWATDHKMVNDFGYGKYLEVFRSSGRDYAALIVNSPSATSDKWYINYSLEIICLDYVADEKANQDRVNSDTISIIRDLENTMRYSNRWQAFCRIDSPFNYRKVDEFGADKCFGWIATLTIKIKKRSGICNIQALMPEYDFETGLIVVPGCDPATYQNSDGSFIQSIASGGTFTSDDVIMTINSVPQTAIPSNKDASFTVPSGATNIKALTGQQDQEIADDDGALFIAGEYANALLTDFYTMANVNEWGHLERFTGDTGGYMDNVTGIFYDVNGIVTTKALAFPNDIRRDYYLRTRMYMRRTGAMGLVALIAFVKAATVGGEGGWRLPNMLEYFHISSANKNQPSYIDSRLFNWSTFNMWSLTINPNNTTQAWRYSAATSTNILQAISQANGGTYIKNF